MNFNLTLTLAVCVDLNLAVCVVSPQQMAAGMDWWSTRPHQRPQPQLPPPAPPQQPGQRRGASGAQPPATAATDQLRPHHRRPPHHHRGQIQQLCATQRLHSHRPEDFRHLRRCADNNSHWSCSSVSGDSLFLRTAKIVSVYVKMKLPPTYCGKQPVY